MPSDIFIKTGSSTWSKAINIFIKTAASTWSTAKNVWLFLDSGWTRVWPLSGVFNVTNPYVASTSGSTTPISGGPPRRIGNSVFGKNGTWNANGWVINSYQYRWRTYSSSTDISDNTRISQTALATYSGPVELVIPASYDREYLSFFIQANSSGGSAYNGFAESATQYDGIYIVRQQPINLTGALSTYVPRVDIQITYSSTWQTGDAYEAESNRTTIEWYRNSANSTIGGTYRGSGSSYTPVPSDLGFYIYAVETRFNSGTDYDLGVNTGVEKRVITTMPVAEALNGATSTSIVSVFRLTDTTTRTIVSSTGASGPYYQMFWYSLNTAPSPETRYDAASTTSTVTEDYNFSNNQTIYFYIRSSTENLGNTTANGIATFGTYSEYGPVSGAASYTYLSPTGSVTVSPSTGVAGQTTFTATPSISSAPSSQISFQWEYFEGGQIGWVNAPGTSTNSTYLPPSNYVTFYGSNLRCLVTANNGVGTLQTAGSATVTDPAPGSFTYSISNSTVTPTMPSAYTNFFNSSGTQINYDWNDTANTTSWMSSITAGGAYGPRNNERFVSSDFWDTTPGGTYTTSVYSINNNRQATVSWGASTNANSYVVSFSGATQTSPITVTGTSLVLTASGSSGSTVTVNSVTAFANGNGTGASKAGTLSGLSGVTIFNGQSGTRSSGPSTAPQVLAPVNTAAPSVSPSSGTAGSTQFSCTTGSWTNNPTSYVYQWQYRESAQNWPPAPGTNTNSTYTPPSDFASIYGNNLRCTVTASNSGGSNSASSGSATVNSPAVTPAITSGPSISWAAGNDFTLSATASNATNIEFQVQYANSSGGTVQNTVTYFMGASAGSRTTGAQQYSWARTRARANNTNTGLSSSFTGYTAWA